MATGILCALAPLGGSSGPPVWFAPDGFLDAKKQSDLSAGAAVVDVLPAHDGDMAIFGAAKIRVGSERLVAWTRQIEDLQRGRYLPIVVRFSDPPRLEDLDRLVLDKSDLNDIRDCQRGDCGLKLSGDEIDRLRRRIAAAGDGWQWAVQMEFRSIMLARATMYRARGSDGMPPYEDRGTPVSAGTEFNGIADRMNAMMFAEPRVTQYLQRLPDYRGEDVESFLYWTKEQLDGGKPIITITHLSMIPATRDAQTEMVIASRQVFATHYLLASLSLLSVTTSSSSGDRYLVYTRRSHVDLLHGFWGGLARRMMESRIRAEGPGVLDATRRRLESGDPPARGLPES